MKLLRDVSEHSTGGHSMWNSRQRYASSSYGVFQCLRLAYTKCAKINRTAYQYLHFIAPVSKVHSMHLGQSISGVELAFPAAWI